MKIAILTFLHAFNYGAELQAFSLQWKLRGMDYDVTLLDVCRPGKNPEYIDTGNFKPIFALEGKESNKSARNRVFSKWLDLLFKFIYFKRNKFRKQKFYSFHKQFSNLSVKRYYNFDALYSENFDFSHFIVGSDQVWNYTNGFSPEPYFLTFVRGAKRISYAASLGHDVIPDEIASIYKEWIEKFDYISLREKEGVEAVSKLIGRKVDNVLDPTLLLDKEEWLSALGIKAKHTSEKYVLVYILSHSSFSLNLARKVAVEIGCKVKIIVPNVWSQYDFTSGIETIFDAGPKEFVELFANASFVVTNSFHGTCFSINFNIPFYATPRAIKKTNSRFLSLLSSLGLRDRLLYDSSNISSPIIAMSFLDSNKQLNILRRYSLDFLNKALKC